MPNIFTTAPKLNIKRNRFRMRNQNTFTCDFGMLVPVYCEEVLPGDTWRGNSSAFVEFMPMVFPVRADIDVFIHHFFVPTRIIWDQFEEFITGEPPTSVDSETPYTPPVEPGFYLNRLFKTNGFQVQRKHGSLLDYMGFPSSDAPYTDFADAPDFAVSQLPFRAYQQIFNDWYLDVNLSDPIPFRKTSGIETNNSYMNRFLTLRYRSWRKDYFTSALPFAQRGGAVEIQSREMLISLESTLTDSIQFVTSDGTVVKSTDIQTDANGNVTDGQGNNIYFDPVGSLGVKGTMFTVEDLRNYLAVQRQLELDSLGGSRYIDWILSNFGVVGDDARLQRAQYLGGSKTPVLVSTVRQTSASQSGSSALGEPAGTATSAGGNNFFSHYFKEHGFVMSIMSVLPKSQYFQGIPRKFLPRERFDYFMPMFQHLGEQAIKNAELYYDPNDSIENNLAEFGYSPRYAEYKWKPNEIHGQMKSTLFDYTMARNFANRPNLNSTFIQMNPSEVSHVFANASTADFSDNHLIVTVYNDFTAVRPMKKNPLPKII